MSASVERVSAAVVQMTSTTDVERNLSTAEGLVTRAAERGARLVTLPENFAFLRSEGQPVPDAQPLDGPWVRRMADLARRHALTLLLGSIPERIDGDSRVQNTSVLLGPDGTTLAAYRKLHLFDIDLPGMEHLKESRSVVAGSEVVVADSPAGRLGLSICYDLRFPELYRSLAQRGAQVLCVPSAFTERTGKAHWEVLLRARAIENLAYVVAPAQVGHHGGGRASHGQAMIVDPWGTVLAQVPDGEGVALADLDFARLERLRRELPALSHARLLATPKR
ncbi:MAG: carbon-nitrogen hydrolase family protein [Betaproteobacteria bacterium]